MMDRKKLDNPAGGTRRGLINDPNLTPEVRNPELEEALKRYSKEKNGENLGLLIEALESTRLLVPANMDGNGRPALCLIDTPEGGKLFSAYTSKERIPRESKSTVIVNMPFSALCSMVTKSDGHIAGIIFNPFTDSLVFAAALLQKIEEDERQRGDGIPKGMQLTPNQYAAFERRQFESAFLPKRFFEQGKELVEQLCEKKEEYIDQLFEEAYEQKRMYPYLPEDFSVMVMNISDDLLLIRVELPNKDMGENSYERIYLAWNGLSEKGRYIMVERTKERGVRALGELTDDWNHIDHGEAPVEGVELPRIIEITKNKKEI